MPIKDVTVWQGDDALDALGPDLTADAGAQFSRIGILEYSGAACFVANADGSTYADSTATGGINTAQIGYASHFIMCTSAA